MTRYHLQPPNILPMGTTKNASSPRMTRAKSENNIRNFHQSQVSPLTPPLPQIHPPENPYHLKQDREARPTENVTNQDEAHFNESLLTLLNGHKDLQKQSFKIIQDITCRREYGEGHSSL